MAELPPPPPPLPPPPSSVGPSAMEKRYDRQLRLWGSTGQMALENARLLLVNPGIWGTGVAGYETMKNLVLPGLGKYTIMDATPVQNQDLGVNFLVDKSQLGQNRAEAGTANLFEMNPHCTSLEALMTTEDFVSNTDNLDLYNFIVVVAPVGAKVLSQLSEHCWQKNITLVYIHSLGFFGHISIQMPEAHYVSDTHPDPATIADLRLLQPWPALIEYATKKTISLQDMDHQAHGHVPWLLLILYYLGKWKDTHDGKLPSTYKDKTEFKKLLNDEMRTDNPEGSEENYEQAVAAVLKNLNEPVPSSAVKELLESPETQFLSPISHNFWYMALGVHDFWKKHGVLPLPGTVPDMKAVSSDYIELQTVYKTKAREDAQEVLNHVRRHEKMIKKSLVITLSEVEEFCRRVAHTKMLHGKQIHSIAKVVDWGNTAKSAAAALTDETSGILIYIGFLAFDRLFVLNSHVIPGADERNFEADAGMLTSIAEAIAQELMAQAAGSAPGKTELQDRPKLDADVQKRLKDICYENARAGGGELHNTASVLGGIASQEIIKIITNQYVPADNTIIWDGMKSTVSVLRV